MTPHDAHKTTQDALKTPTRRPKPTMLIFHWFLEHFCSTKIFPRRSKTKMTMTISGRLTKKELCRAMYNWSIIPPSGGLARRVLRWAMPHKGNQECEHGVAIRKTKDQSDIYILRRQWKLRAAARYIHNNRSVKTNLYRLKICLFRRGLDSIILGLNISIIPGLPFCALTRTQKAFYNNLELQIRCEYDIWVWLILVACNGKLTQRGS